MGSNPIAGTNVPVSRCTYRKGPALRSLRVRAHAPSLLAGTFLLLVYAAAAAPAVSNTVIETIGLALLAAVLLAMAVSAAGFLGRDLKITGITAEAITALISWALMNNHLVAAGFYVLICQALALAGCVCIRLGLPRPQHKTRPGSRKETDLAGMAAA